MGATFSRVKTWGAEVLTYADLNAEFDNILTNLTPAGVDDESTNAAAMQTTADPYPAASPSLATSLQGEIQRLRYIVQQITGMSYWYVDPVDTIWVPASAMIPLVTNGAEPQTLEEPNNKEILDILVFDAATQEYAGFNLPMPDTWNLGTIKAKFYWAPGSNSGSAGDTVEWAIYGVAIANDGALDVAPAGGSAQVISDAVLTGESGSLHVSGATPAITVSGTPAVGKLVHFNVSRNVGGSDNFGYDARLIGVLIQFTKSSTAGAAW